MRFSLQLDDASLHKVARRAAVRAKVLREKLIQRATEGKTFAVWDVPYGQVEAVQGFVLALQHQFPKPINPDMYFFVNNGNAGAYQSFLIAGWPDIVFPHIQPMLNSIVGITRNFQLQPELLFAMSVNGIFDMEAKLTPAKVLRAYGGRQPEVAAS